MREVLLGHVSVDSGEIVIVDPCYKDKPVSDSGKPLCVTFTTGLGDGDYPVHAHVDEYGTVKKVVVTLA